MFIMKLKVNLMLYCWDGNERLDTFSKIQVQRCRNSQQKQEFYSDMMCILLSFSYDQGDIFPTDIVTMIKKSIFGLKKTHHQFSWRHRFFKHCILLIWCIFLTFIRLIVSWRRAIDPSVSKYYCEVFIALLLGNSLETGIPFPFGRSLRWQKPVRICGLIWT